MQKSRAERLKNIFRNIDKKSEAEKARLVWFMASFCVCGIFCIWLYGTSSSLSRLGAGRIDLSTLPAFPQLDPVNLDEALQKSGEALNDYAASSNAAWQERGDKYIAEREVLLGEDFSTLKLSGVENGAGAVLLKYDHYYKDVPVLGSGLVLSVENDNQEITEKENRLQRGVEVVIDPELPAKEAAAIAGRELDDTFVFSAARLAIVKQAEGCFLVWKTDFRSEAGEEKSILVGTKHGSIIPAETGKQDQASNMAE